MRKIRLQILAATIFFAFAVNGQTLLSESFEGTFPPAGWTLENAGTGNPWTQGTTANLAKSGTKSMKYAYSQTAAGNAWAFSPALNFTAGTNYVISFWYRGRGYNESLRVQIKGAATAAAPAIATVFNSTTISSTVYSEAKTYYTAPATGAVYLAFNCYSIADMFELHVDSIVVAAGPSCIPPTTTTISNVTATSATLNWTAASGATGYQYAMGTTGTPPASGTATTALSNTFTLSASTKYYLFLRSACSGSTFSDWKIDSVTTPCAASPIPYTMPVSTAPAGGIPNCSVVQNVNNDAKTWFAGSFTTDPPGITSPAMIYEYSSVNAANDWLFTQGLALTGGVTYQLSYKYMNDGTLPSSANYYPEKMKVMYGLQPDDASMTFPLADYPVVASASAISASVSFTPASSGTYFIGFHAYSSADQDLLILDDVAVITDPTTPVSLLNFEGSRVSLGNLLSWTTASELNNKGFELQRSADGVEFSSLQFIASKGVNGNSSSTLNYAFTDVKPLSGANYYRLAQIDKDGKTTLSKVVVIKGLRPLMITFSSLFPNPAKEQLKASIESPKNGLITFLFTDMAGKVVNQQTAAVVPGDNLVTLSVASLPAGSYLVKATCADGCETSVKKFVKE